ncbi:hypothetical protein MY4038_000235 [Beauveria bassiana]
MQISCLTEDGKQPWLAPLFGSLTEADHGRCTKEVSRYLATFRQLWHVMFFQWLSFLKQTPWDSNMQIYGKTRQRPSPIPPRMRLDSPAVYIISVTAEKSAQGDPQIKIDRAA